MGAHALRSLFKEKEACLSSKLTSSSLPEAGRESLPKHGTFCSFESKHCTFLGCALFSECTLWPPPFPASFFHSLTGQPEIASHVNYQYPSPCLRAAPLRQMSPHPSLSKGVKCSGVSSNTSHDRVSWARLGFSKLSTCPCHPAHYSSKEMADKFFLSELINE